MSGVAVPTFDQFAALAQRVTALETGAVTPPNPEPEPPQQPGVGVQARRVHELIETFGVNTFSSLDEHNVWGSWPADYRPASVAAGLNFITGSSGFRFRLREYHYAGREAMQRTWFTQIAALMPGTQSTLCVGANGSAGDVPSMVRLQQDTHLGIVSLEGLNEGNTDFGSGNVSTQVQLDIQNTLSIGTTRPDTLMGPSIVAGTPHPEGWVTGYAGDTLDELNGAMAYGNGHYYPPHCPDVPGTGYSVTEYVDGLKIAYDDHPIHLTEFHPTLYAAGTLAMRENMARLAGRARDRRAIPDFRASASRDPYYTLLTLLRCAQTGVGLWWYALFDYGTTYECGLFPKTGSVDPRTSALALRDLCTICTDNTPTMRTFAPGALDVIVQGLPAHCDWDLYQASDGRFLLPLWNAAQDQGGGSVTVTIALGAMPYAITETDPLGGTKIERTPATTLTVELEAGVTFLTVWPSQA